jgi:RNase P/RNase MRP subunit POP5
VYNTLIVNTPAVVLTLKKSSSGSHFTVMYLGVRGSVLRAVRSAEPAHSFVFLYILLGYLLPGWMTLLCLKDIVGDRISINLMRGSGTTIPT